jgi:hypothetical protein
MLKIGIRICLSLIIGFIVLIIALLIPLIPVETGVVLKGGTKLEPGYLPILGYLFVLNSDGMGVRKFWYTDIAALMVLAGAFFIYLLLIWGMIVSLRRWKL